LHREKNERIGPRFESVTGNVQTAKNVSCLAQDVAASRRVMGE
jgi:hypothetical protein